MLEHDESKERWYPVWLANSISSAEYCINKKKFELAEEYIAKANMYLTELKRIYGEKI